MADQDNISQLAAEVGADASDTRVSQQAAEVGADGSPTWITQMAVEAGADGSPTRVSQLVVELGYSPTTTPPTDSPTPVFAFGLGALEVNWWLVPQLSDSGIELRDKVVKSFRATGKLSNPKFQVYGYGPTQEIDMDDIEEGINSRTGLIIMPDTNQVAQSKRFPVNVPNCMTHTVRLQGMYPGTGERDRIDEIVYEVAQQGIRR